MEVEMLKPVFMARKHRFLNDPFSCYSLNVSVISMILFLEYANTFMVDNNQAIFFPLRYFKRINHDTF